MFPEKVGEVNNGKLGVVWGEFLAPNVNFASTLLHNFIGIGRVNAVIELGLNSMQSFRPPPLVLELYFTS